VAQYRDRTGTTCETTEDVPPSFNSGTASVNRRSVATLSIKLDPTLLLVQNDIN